MTRLTTARILAALLSCLLIFPAAGWGDSHARIVRLSYLQGPVDLDRGQGTGFERAILNMPLVEGSQLATREGGVAEVEFEDGSTVRLVPNSRVEFTALSLRDDGARLSTVSLIDGTAYFDVQHMDKMDEFSIHLPTRDLVLKRGGQFRLDLAGGEAHLAVLKGELEVVGDRELTVKKNATITFDLSDATRYSVADSVAALTYDPWNKERAKLRDESLNYSNPSSYGYGWLGGLSYYGNYMSAPGCGFGWQPTGMSIGWSPWNSGAWVWYPGQGYRWVSSDPWGFGPYNFGSWSYGPSGWYWCSPTGSYRNWQLVTVPVILTPPAGFVRPHAPLTVPNPNGPGTIWVGKGSPDGRHGQLAGDSLVGRHGGHGRPEGPSRSIISASSRGDFAGGRTGVSSAARTDGGVGRGRSGEPVWRGSAPPAGNPSGRVSDGGRFQAPPSRSDSGRVSASGNDGGRFNPPASHNDGGRFSPPPSRTDGGHFGGAPSSGGGGHYSPPSAPSGGGHMGGGGMSAPSAPSPHVSAPSAPSAGPSASPATPHSKQ